MKNIIIVLIALTLILVVSNGAYAWTDITNSTTLTYDGGTNGVYNYPDGLRVINDDSVNPLYFQIDPGVTLNFGDNERGLRIEGNVILIAKGLPTSTGYVIFDSDVKYKLKSPMLDLVFYENPKTGEKFYPKAVIEYCEFKGPIETALRSESADIIIRYNRIHTDCNGIYMADDRFHTTDWVFSQQPVITGNVIEGYGGLYKYPLEYAKGCTLSSIEYAGSGIYFHAGVLNSITRNNILIQGDNEKGTGCGIYFRSLYESSTFPSYKNIVNNNVIDHIPADKKLLELNCGINIGINIYSSGTTPVDFDLEDMLFYGNNNIITESVLGIFINKSNWEDTPPQDLPLYIDYNDYYENYNDMVILGDGGRYYSVEFGTNNQFDDPNFISVNDVNYRLDPHSILYDSGTSTMNGGAVIYEDIYEENISDDINLVDMGAYSGGEECYRIQKHIPPGTQWDNTRSWSGTVIKDHNEYIILEDDMVVEEYAEVSFLETSFIEDLPPVTWKFDGNYGINTFQPATLLVTHIDPSGAPCDPNHIYGSSWQGISADGFGRIEFDNFKLGGCDVAFTGSYRRLFLYNGSIENCSQSLIHSPVMVDLNLRNLTSIEAETPYSISNLIYIEAVSRGSVLIEDCSFNYDNVGILIQNTNSPVTLRNFDLVASSITSKSIQIDAIVGGASLIVEDCNITSGHAGLRVYQSTGDITIRQNTISAVQGANNDISIYLDEMTGQDLVIDDNIISYNINGIILLNLTSEIDIINNTITTSYSYPIMGVGISNANGSHLLVENNQIDYGCYGLTLEQSNTPLSINGDHYTSSSAGETAINIGSNEGSISIDGVHITGGDHGIKLGEVLGDISITGASINASTCDGINISNCSQGTITIDDSYVFYIQNGIYLDTVDDITNISSSFISGTTGTDNSACVSIQGVTQNVTLDDLTCHSDNFGIYSTENSGDITVSNSSFYNPLPEGGSKGIYSSMDTEPISLINNSFTDFNYGIHVGGCTDVITITNNTMNGCSYGTYLTSNGQILGGITLENNSYTMTGPLHNGSKAIYITSAATGETADRCIGGESITGYFTGINVYGLNSKLEISSSCDIQDCFTGISLYDCNSSLNQISDCTIDSDIAYNGEYGKGISMHNINGIQINSTEIETKGDCICAASDVNFTIDDCLLISTGTDASNINEGIGILSFTGFMMTNSCIRDCASHGIKVIGDSDIDDAPTVFLGSFYSSGLVEFEGRNLIYNCGQEDSNPAIHPTNDQWMIDLIDDSQTLERYATIQSTHNDFIIFQPNQVVNNFYGPCFGKMIEHIDSSTVFIDTSWINMNYWGRCINNVANDGKPHRIWFSWMQDDQPNLEWINVWGPDRYTSFNIPFVDLPSQENDAIGLPNNSISSRLMLEPNAIMENSRQIAINSTNATKIKNALMEISSLDYCDNYTTDQIISQLSQWANPNGTGMLELESHRLKIRKLISQKKFEEASTALESWLSNPAIMREKAESEKLFLSYSKQLAKLNDQDPLELNEWYSKELDKIYGFDYGQIEEEKGEKMNDVEETILPSEFCIHPSYPNPFNPTATLKIDLPETADVKIVIFNVMGQRVYTEVHEQMPAGYKTFNINGQLWSSGTYFVVANAGKMNKVQKIVLIK